MRRRTRLPRRAIIGVIAGAETPLKVSQLNSMPALFGTELLGSTAHSCKTIRVVVIDARLVRLVGMRDEEADLAQHFLHRAVRVIEKRAFLMDGEFVSVFFAGWNRFLADPRDAVLFDGNFQAVPVHGGGFRQAIFEDDADAVALIDLDRGTGAASVVTPGVDGLERRDLALHDFGRETKDFDRRRRVRTVGRERRE